MKTTPSLFIITADDFPVLSPVSLCCDRLVEALSPGSAKHLYGGRHYHGHHVVVKKSCLRAGPLHLTATAAKNTAILARFL